MFSLERADTHRRDFPLRGLAASCREIHLPQPDRVAYVQQPSALLQREWKRPAPSAPAPDPDLSLLAELPGAVLLLDADGVVGFINRVAEERLDRVREDVLGRDLFRDVFPHLESEGLGGRYRAGVADHPWSIAWDTTVPGRDADRHVSVGIRSYAGSGCPMGLVLVEDRTALVCEQRRRERAERLASVGDLATGTAHEINNPLASIKGFAQLLARETLDRGRRQMLEIIGHECSRVAQVVDGLLAFAGQQRVVEPEAVHVDRLVEEVLSLRRYALESAGITIELDLATEGPPLLAESGLVQRPVLALVAQGERSLQERGSERRLEVRARASEAGVVLTVADNGPGMSPVRLSESMKGSADVGKGLGLADADAFVRAAGGLLTVESVEGSGTTCTVRLPLPVVRPAPPPRASSDEAVRPGSDVFRVLVADDESTLRLALAIFLGRHGCQVDQAADAEEAYRMAVQGEYDLAFVDVRMPGDGIELLGRLDSSPLWEGRAVLMTGDHTSERVRGQIEAGRPYLIKPFDLMEAVRLVEEVRSGAGGVAVA
jgi:signal transduction histidine kinase